MTTIENTSRSNTTNTLGENMKTKEAVSHLNLVSVEKDDPRLLPVELDGRTYITSALLHKQKRDAGMTKYERTDVFVKMIRNIDCYGRLIGNEDLIELNSKSMILGKSTDLVGVLSANKGARGIFLRAMIDHPELKNSVLVSLS